MKKSKEPVKANNKKPELWQPIAPRKRKPKRRLRKKPQVAITAGQKRKIVRKNKTAAPNKPGTQSKAKTIGKQANLWQRWKALSLKQKFLRLGTAGVAIILVAVLAVYLIYQSLLGKINFIDPKTETLPEEFDLPTEKLINPIPEVEGVTNILLLGIDARSRDSIEERSDAMMILTIDEVNKKIKLTSLQRDMLVYLPGKENPQKLNSANVHGGPLLAMRVINETLRLNIQNYVVVNMQGMEELVDIVGGIEIDVESNEVAHINNGVVDANNFSPGGYSDGIITGGLQLLNGRQAVAYSRIRALDSDYGRMARQRTVLQGMLNAFSKASLGAKTSMITEGLEYITTNLTEKQITNLGLKTLPLMNSTIEQLQIPIEGYFREYSGLEWVNLCDFNGMIPLLQEFIWGRTYAFDQVKIIAGAPNSGSEIREPTYVTTRFDETELEETEEDENIEGMSELEENQSLESESEGQETTETVPVNSETEATKETTKTDVTTTITTETTLKNEETSTSSDSGETTKTNASTTTKDPNSESAVTTTTSTLPTTTTSSQKED